MARSYIRARRIGIALQGFRKDAGLTLEQVAAELSMNKSTISRIEAAQTVTRPQTVRMMLNLYGIQDKDEVERWAQLAKEAKTKDAWWSGFDLPNRLADLVALETDAISISVYEASVVPGIAQTERYARTIIEDQAPVPLTEAVINERVEIRMRRQERLVADVDPPQVAIILDDSVLQRSVGGPEVMKDQAQRLIELGHRPNITVQIARIADGVHLALPGSVTLLEFNDLMPASIYLDTVAGDLLIDAPEAIQRVQRALKAIRSHALSPDESRRLLEIAAK
ncbi:helix-turn-helix domain-containing protein [Fodinicola feengrottensis]|uniref:helix-turn-helix domain-containing protein n=1 Tax=Fodinicola feengrottensis TaxID=435914 RepID=UPI0013D23CDC|nr:helix-turn-helix transcriptional regulator [Fodinicola feengrottensis]